LLSSPTAHASEANAKLAELEAQAAAAFEAAERETREIDAWASASAAGSMAALEDFRRHWPQSKYAHAASLRVKELKGTPSRRRLLQGVGLGAGAAAVVGLGIVEFRPGRLVWRLLYDQSIRTFAGHTSSVNSVAFAPDGLSVLSGSFDALKLWDVATGKEIRTFAMDFIPDVHSVAFAPDGRTALSGEDPTLKLWDVETRKEIRSLIGPTSWVNSVAFSPDGRSALSGGDDSTLKLWDIAAGKQIRSFEGHFLSVTSVAFSPDGRTALSGSNDNPVKLWDLTPGL
jgi:WD40 repeat protein